MLTSPFIEPELLQEQDEERDGDRETLFNSPNDLLFENQITEGDAKGLSIENILELFLTGTVNGLRFSADTATGKKEVQWLIKSLFNALMTKVNDGSLRSTFIQFVNKFTTAPASWSAYLIQTINYIFDFKMKIAANVTAEYNTWLSTRTNGIWAIKEYDPGALPLLTKYWNATPSPPSPIKPHEYWSAAFISWVIKQSGAGDLFSYSGGHITYMRQAKRNRDGGIQNPFRLYTIPEFIVRMQPGDMLCKARDGSGLTFTNLLTHSDTAAHVDIITEIDKPGNKIRGVGGNVCDNVDHKILTIDGNKICNSDGAEYFAGIGIGIA